MRDDRPEPASELDQEGMPDMEEPYPGEVATGVRWDEMVPPGDAPAGVEEFGITAAEERAEEPLAERVRREEPDVGVGPGDGLDEQGGPPRLVEPDLGGTPDDEADAVGSDVFDGGALSAEEAALRVTTEDDAPGLAWDAGPGYLDDEPAG